MFHVIGSSNCSWCDKALDYIEMYLDEDYSYTDVNVSPIIKLLMRKAGLSSVPQIWEDGDYIGGYSDLVAKYNKESELD